MRLRLQCTSQVMVSPRASLLRKSHLEQKWPSSSTLPRAVDWEQPGEDCDLGVSPPTDPKGRLLQQVLELEDQHTTIRDCHSSPMGLYDP